MNIELFKTQYSKFKNSASNQFLLLYSSFEEQIVFLSKICKETDGQTLISCSSITEINQIFEILKKYISKEQIEIINKNFFKNELLIKNKKINSNKAKVIISTKTGIFCPFYDLKNIIIINEESKDHKQYDLNPRYNIKDISFFLSNKNKTKLILTSQSPSIETYYKNLQRINIQEKNIETTINLVDQKVEKKSKNDLYISLQLQEKIKNSINNNKKILIINNDLKTEFKSNKKIKEEIELFIKESSRTGALLCAPEALLCAPEILTIDSKSPIDRSDIEKSQIIIGTEFLVKNYLYNINNIDTIAILSIDNFIYSDKIESNENLFDYLTYFINISKEKNINNLLIQTKNIENEILNLAVDQNYKAFYDKEINIRKQLNFPPFSKIIELIIKEKDSTKLEEKKNKIIEILENNNIDIIGEKTIEKELKTKIIKQENIVIKIVKAHCNASQQQILKKLTEYCLIDVK